MNNFIKLDGPPEFQICDNATITITTLLKLKVKINMEMFTNTIVCDRTAYQINEGILKNG